jgi:tape measure domain-containing protein
VSVVASVAINVDARDAATKLRQFQQQSSAAGKAAQELQKTTNAAGAAATKAGREYQTAANGMRFFIDATGRARKENGQFVTTAEAAAAGLQKQGRAAQSAGNSLNGLLGTLGKLAVAYVGIRTAQAAIQTGIERIESERRIQFLARSYGEVEQLAGAAAASAAKFGESQTTANQALANAYGRLRPVGVSLTDIVSTYNGFNTAARISGASSTEASNAFTQLAQALGSGALRGDEFNSIAEQVPAILTAISKETGVAQGALRDYAADGNITADVVIRALKRIETEGADQLAEALDGPQQKIKDFQNASEDLAVAFSRELMPQMTDAVKALANALRALEPILVGLGRVAAQVFNYIAGLANRIVDLSSGGRRAQAEIQASAQAQQATRERFGLSVLSPAARQFREQYERNILFNFDAQERDRRSAATAMPTTGATPTGAAPTGSSSGGSKGKSGIDKAAREAEKLAQEIQRSLELGDRLGTEFSRQVLLLGEANEIEQKRLQIQFDYEDRAKQIAELKNTEQQTNLSQLNDEIRRLEIIDLQTEALKKQAEEADKLFKKSLEGAEFGVAGEGTVASGLTDAIAKLKEDLNPIKLATESIVNGATAIGDAFSTAFGEVITGAKSTQEALADAFKSIGQAFISMALEIIAKQMTLIILQTILNALSGGGTFGTANKNLTGTGALKSPSAVPSLKVGGYAEGGFVTGPTNALIGEGGEPEYVIPASKMRTAMGRYAGGARGNSVIPGNGGEPAAAGGGVATMEPIDVRYSVERINNVDYVTADQFQAGMARAAQQGAVQGERRAMRSLKNSAATRRGVGLS